MILRDAVISERPFVLEHARHRVAKAAEVASTPAAAPREASALTQEPPVGGPRTSIATSVLAPAQPVIEYREPKLTFESVAAWLAVQDGDTRAACASVLADEIAQVCETAKNDGLAHGRAKGEQEARRALDGVHALVTRIAEAAEQAFAEEQSKLAAQCVDVVVEAFVKIAGTTLATREASAGVVAQILGRVKEARKITIRVTPTDLAPLEAEEPALRAALTGRSFTLVADPRLVMGGCVVETELGSLDGRLDVQLRELFETLRSAKSQSGEFA